AAGATTPGSAAGEQTPGATTAAGSAAREQASRAAAAGQPARGRAARSEPRRGARRAAWTPSRTRRVPRLDPGHAARSAAKAQVAPVRRHRGGGAGRQLDSLPAQRGQEGRARARGGRAPRGRRDPRPGLRHRHRTTGARGAAMRRLVPAALLLSAACGPKGPPPDFAPDPGLVAQIRELRISTSVRACPGETFGALYTAVLNDGTV